MRIVFAGPDGVGKRKVAFLLAKEFPHLRISANPEVLKDPYAVGPLADYRMELELSMDRVHDHNADDFILVNSLLDSFAYSSTRMVTNSSNGDWMEATLWTLVAQLIAIIFKDSFKSDYVFVFPYKGEDVFAQNIEIAMRTILDELKIPYHIIENDDDLRKMEECATIIKDGTDDSGRDNLQSKRQD